MFKKFFAVILFAVIFFCGQNNFASAKDYYLGDYENGSEGYLMSETIKYFRDYNGEYIEAEGYSCTVKAIDSGGNIQYISYKWKQGPYVESLCKNGSWYLMNDMQKLYNNEEHPEMVLILMFRGIWKEMME